MGNIFATVKCSLLIAFNPQRDAARVNFYIWYLLILFVVPAIYVSWHDMLHKGGHNDEKLYSRKLASLAAKTDLTSHSNAVSVVGLYFIVCLRSLKLKFQNEKMPLVIAYQNRVEATDIMSTQANIQPAIV